MLDFDMMEHVKDTDVSSYLKRRCWRISKNTSSWRSLMYTSRLLSYFRWYENRVAEIWYIVLCTSRRGSVDDN
jgi:hypothetical protein